MDTEMKSKENSVRSTPSQETEVASDEWNILGKWDGGGSAAIIISHNCGKKIKETLLFEHKNWKSCDRESKCYFCHKPIPDSIRTIIVLNGFTILRS